MFLDIEVVIGIDAPDPQNAQVDAVDRKDLRQKHSARVGNKLGYQRNNVNRRITQGEELVDAGSQLRYISKALVIDKECVPTHNRKDGTEQPHSKCIDWDLGVVDAWYHGAHYR